jgi:predicted phosphodiesterase
MKLKIASDLHLDHYPMPDRNGIMDSTYQGEYDFLVVAGDAFVNCPQGFFKENVIFIPGNHEFYREGYARGAKTHYIRQESNYRFVCSTLFSRTDPVYAFDIVRNISDFEFTDLTEFQELFEKEMAFLEAQVQKGDIVVTHFVPTYKGMNPKYKGSVLNSFFMTELSDFILDREPSIWICGHTHYPFDCMLGKTHIICNPLGYPGENKVFNPDLIIDI